MHPPEGPPVCTALKWRPSSRPPPISKTIWRRVKPIGTSISPVLTTAPGEGEDLSALALLGADRAVPVAPCPMTAGMLAKVSTLLISVGRPHRPDAAG